MDLTYEYRAFDVVVLVPAFKRRFVGAIERGGINNNNNNNKFIKKSVKSLPVLTNSFITISLDELLY